MSDAHVAIASRATLEERISETCAQAAAILGAETASVTVDEATFGPDAISAELPGEAGRLVLTAPTGRRWSEADRRSLPRLLSLIGGPIDDARRLDLGQRVRHLRAALGRPSAARDVLVAFRDVGAATIGADIAVVVLDDGAGNGVDWPTRGPTVVIDQVAVTGNAQYVAVDGIDRAWWAVLPLGVLGESMGVVAIGYRRRQPFDAVQRSFLELVATLLAYVIDQSGAYAREHAARAEAERTSAQLRLLQRFASDLSTADTSRSVARILLRRIVGSTGAFGGAVVSTVRAPNLETIATVGLDGEAVDAVSDVATWLLEDDRWNDERIILDLDVLPVDRAAPLAARGVGGLAGYLVESATSRIGLVLVVWLGASPRARSSDHVAGLIAMAVPSLVRAARFDVEHHIADTLQRSLLEVPAITTSGLRWSARYRPGSGVAGGDWYDLIELDDHRLAVAVGDIVGRGVDAAAAMGQVRSATRALAHQIDDPAELLEALDDLTIRTGKGCYSSLVYVVVDTLTMELRHASAGHPPPALGRGGRSAVVLTDGHGPLLGVECSRRSAIEALRPGSQLVLYTDGLVAGHTRVIDDGIARLLGVLDGLDGVVGPEQTCRALMRELVGPAGAIDEETDDVAVVVVELTERGETGSS